MEPGIVLPAIQSTMPECPKCHRRRLRVSTVGFMHSKHECACGYLMVWRVSLKTVHHVSPTEARWLGQPNNPVLVGEREWEREHVL